MSDTVAMGVRFTKEQMEVLRYLVLRDGRKSKGEVVRAAVERQIDFERLREPARIFFEQQDQLIEQAQQSIDAPEPA